MLLSQLAKKMGIYAGAAGIAGTLALGALSPAAALADAPYSDDNMSDMDMSASPSTVVVVPNPPSSGIGDLFVMDRLFGGGFGNGIIGPSGGTSLGDLFILNQLFGRQGWGGGIGYGGTNRLGQLFVLDRLFGGRFGNGIVDTSGGTSLGDIFILDQLFR